MKSNKFIQTIEIDWNRIPERSYLRNISALKNLKYLEFNSNITFFAGENIVVQLSRQKSKVFIMN